MVPRIEAKLARLGLRPTERERTGMGWRAVMPMLAMAALGVVKTGLGVVRGKPVGFLIAAVFLTFILALILKARARFLTVSGERALEEMRRSKRSRSSDFPAGDAAFEMSVSVALLGSAAVTAYPGLLPEGAGFRKELRQMAHQNGGSSCSSGSSCTSGCGSGGGDSGGGGSSCGGGGCGGCGGGGD
jgi:uncharacterized membrane protein YgcG